MTDKMIRRLGERGHLYKMYSNKKYNYDALEKKKIYLSTPDRFNDIFDSCSFIDRREFNREYLLKKYANDADIVNYINSIPRYENVFRHLEMRETSAIDILNELKGININKKSSYNFAQDERDAAKLYNSYFKEIEKVRNSYYITCFTENEPRRNISMWHNYANNYKGFCVNFSFEEVLNKMCMSSFSKKDLGYQYCKHIFKVKYSDTFNCINISHLLSISPKDVCNDKIIKKEVEKALKHKSSSWKNEKEWRLIIRKDDKFLDKINSEEKGKGILIDAPVIDNFVIVENYGRRKKHKIENRFCEMTYNIFTPYKVLTMNKGQVILQESENNDENNLKNNFMREFGAEI